MSSNGEKYHEPVLLKEILEGLKVEKGKTFVDATLGDGGHALAILEAGANVIGLDYNNESLERAKERLSSFENFKLVKANFKDIDKFIDTRVDGILYDLGYSSSQLEDDLGLSFSNVQKLDMRLEEELGVTAKDLLMALSETELEKLFSEYGEERYSKRIAKYIVQNRGVKKLETTKDLADLVVEAVPPGQDRLHPATRVFQALRIVINDEFRNLRESLPRAARLLLPGGRMAIISFHSLEDRIVKQFGEDVQPDLKAVTKKPIVPGEAEVNKNPRARSAKLRIYEKSN